MRLAVAALLALIPIAPALAGWQLISAVDPMTDQAATIATISAPGATLRLACKRTGPELIFSAPVAARTVGLNIRFDDGPIVPRVAVVGSDFRTVYPWLASPAAAMRDVARASRLRVQVFPTGSAPAFFDFPLAGSRDVVRQLGCK